MEEAENTIFIAGIEWTREAHAKGFEHRGKPIAAKRHYETRRNNPYGQQQAYEAYLAGLDCEDAETAALVARGDRESLRRLAYRDRVSPYHRKLILLVEGLDGGADYLETMLEEVETMRSRVEDEIEGIEREIRWLDLDEGYEDLEHLLDEVHRIDRRLRS